jgi:hypothetical protein
MFVGHLKYFTSIWYILCRLAYSLIICCTKKKLAILCTRGARWFLFKPKIPIWVNFGGPQIGKCYILWPFGTYCVHLVHFSSFSSCTDKNLATLVAPCCRTPCDIVRVGLNFGRMVSYDAVRPEIILSHGRTVESYVKVFLNVCNVVKTAFWWAMIRAV